MQEMQKIVCAMNYKRFNKGETIIKYGDVGKEYYVLIEGKVKVNVYEKGTDPNIPNLNEKIIF
jgi:CRP-like cAMP-binding protein